jgi:hypothetical protein
MRNDLCGGVCGWNSGDLLICDLGLFKNEVVNDYVYFGYGVGSADDGGVCVPGVYLGDEINQ